MPLDEHRELLAEEVSELEFAFLKRMSSILHLVMQTEPRRPFQLLFNYEMAAALGCYVPQHQ
jgi:hypothetical protein